jgi:YesN/AraC family two-component response regulator
MRKILLVEDEKMIRYGIYVMIENSGVPYYELTECRNGKEAIMLLKKNEYDLVLTDIRMPVMTGLELSKWIYETLDSNERPLLVAISGYAEFEYAREMLKFQAMDYLLKPVDRKELSQVLWHAEEVFREKGGENVNEEMTKERAALTCVSQHKMQCAIDYIRQNYGRTFDMAEVSNYVSMNYTMFSSTFKSYTGENFSTYLKKLRIEKSKRFLRKTDMSIGDISKKVGFEDGRVFGKIFKEQTGLSPSAFRESCIIEKN